VRAFAAAGYLAFATTQPASSSEAPSAAVVSVPSGNPFVSPAPSSPTTVP
jgi:hypothetical protein